MKRGELVGSSYDKVRDNYRAYIVEDNVQINLRRFNNQADAHKAWKLGKAGRLNNLKGGYVLTDRVMSGLENLIDSLRN